MSYHVIVLEKKRIQSSSRTKRQANQDDRVKKKKKPTEYPVDVTSHAFLRVTTLQLDPRHLSSRRREKKYAPLISSDQMGERVNGLRLFSAAWIGSWINPSSSSIKKQLQSTPYSWTRTAQSTSPLFSLFPLTFPLFSSLSFSCYTSAQTRSPCSISDPRLRISVVPFFSFPLSLLLLPHPII